MRRLSSRRLAVMHFLLAAAVSATLQLPAGAQESYAPASAEPGGPPSATEPEAASLATENNGVADRLTWMDNYAAALRQAETMGRILVVRFRGQPAGEQGTKDAAAFEREVLGAGAVTDVLAQCVLCRVDADCRIRVGGEEVELLKHEAFRALGGQPGFAVIDTVRKDTPQFRQVVDTVTTARRFPSSDTLMAAVERHLPQEALAHLAELTWRNDYGQAIRQAEAERRMLFVYFHDDPATDVQQQFERDAFSSVGVRRRLGRFVLARIPTRTAIKVGGREMQLMRHPSFETMYGRAGMAIVDTTDEKSPHFRQVVSTFPLSHGRRYHERRMGVILGLPRGTLTQRTLIYAVRMHPEHPASTDGKFDAMLAAEAESHSQHQAAIDNQGHHNWDYRFQRISAQLPGGMAAQEVCAESWPGQELVDAAEECVSSWRQSSGHWGAVSGRQPLFGYDMKLGRRAVWYATGIFGRH